MKKILLVDDNDKLLAYLEMQLIKAGYEVVTASTGLSGIKLLMEQQPDYIFIDYFLPDINGDKLCPIIRKMEHLKGVYLVVMSAAAFELKLELRSIGANTLIAKGSFKETTRRLLSAINDAAGSPVSKSPDGIMGLGAVYPRQMTRELLGQYRHLQTMLDSIAEGIVELSHGQIVYANPAAKTLLGKPRDQLWAMYPKDLFDEPVRSQIESLISPDMGPDMAREHQIRFHQRILSIRKLPFQGDADAVILRITDVTDQIQAEKALRDYQDHLESLVEERTAELQRANEKLHQVQKMESLGLMAGGIAHDLNNILSGIVSYPDLILMDLPDDSKIRKPVEVIRESGRRAAEVVSDLLTIARGVVTHMDVHNLNVIVEDYLESPEHRKLVKMRQSVRINTELAIDMLNMNCSVVHIKKVLMNLITNASEAIEVSGTITISTEKQYLGQPVAGYESVRTGEYVLLRVSDNGSGIPSDDLERIFEPFYTKKIMGRSGTGLGLAVVWNTVQDHEGYINVESDKNGTTFNSYFPVSRKAAATGKEEIPLKDYIGQGEKILIVDDEKTQREIAAELLTRLGYAVESVSSGEEAIQTIEEHPVDLIVLDMVMPTTMSGRETYDAIQKMNPAQKAIVVTGFAETADVKTIQELGAGRYIRKPYSLMKIGLAVKEELDSRHR